MSLEKLLDEVRQKGEVQLATEMARIEAEKKAIIQARDKRVASLADDIRRRAGREADRERAQRLAGAKVQGRKLVYEARARRAARALSQAQAELQAFTRTPEYSQVLRRMVAYASERLGGKIKVYGRAEDSALLKGAAGRAFQAAAIPALGGILAETTDGSRRLNLTFDELLRTHADSIRQLVAA